ncbi:unnamed protein product [Sphenostylis stenocarpa]|uniref:Disease resistance R13L4/SHOC-2-like LRR domain-containing protein n=1 Tax=Sphenostylis stenocarpa TaxID=92480 RepID=A0AA86VPD4_9FABA|nr:unnamed protein product [Sphenostylis stenocarpa]
MNYSDTSIPTFIGTLTSLIHMDLSWTGFMGSIPPQIGNLSNLVYLDLSNYYYKEKALFTENVDWLSSLSKLEYLDLGGSIPDGIRNLTLLQNLDLSGNQFDGPIPTSFGNLSNLREMYFSNLKLNQKALTNKLGDFKNIDTLDFYGNKIGGDLPRSLGKLVSLRSLELSENLFSGNPFESLGSLSKLSALYIDHNRFQGVVKEDDFANLTRLKWFDASGNNLTLKVGPSWHPTFQLSHLDMSSWQNQLSGEITPTMSNLSFLSMLDLSYNNLRAKIPTGTQLKTCDASNFIGNDLCGPPLAINCSSNNSMPMAINCSSNNSMPMAKGVTGMEWSGFL